MAIEKKKPTVNAPETEPTTPKAPETEAGAMPATPIIKPSGFSLDKFKSKRADALASIVTDLGGLKVHKLAEAKDYARLHPDEENYWSYELCFASVPVKGDKKEGRVHLIDEDLAMLYLPSGKIMRYRLALATKPYDNYFLCIVPTRNLDNAYNEMALRACNDGKTLWTQLISRKSEGVESYKIEYATDPDAFPEPKWPTAPLMEIIFKAFAPNCIIEDDRHPGLLRLIGAKQNLA
jgi:hypothetical protein